jgi:ketosteroid isomerase-like protein
MIRGSEMSEIEKIRECSDAFDAVLKVGDGDQCASFYVEDGIIMPPNAALIQGRAAIAKHFNDLGADSSVSGEILKTEVSGDLAYQQSRVTWDSDDTVKYTDCLDVLAKQDDGSWHYVISTWNSEEGLDQR